MIEKLRRDALKAKGIQALLLFAAAAAVFVFLVWGSIPLLLHGPESIDGIAVGDLEGRYVALDTNALLGTYAQTTSDGSVSSQEYVLPVQCSDGIYLIGVETASKKNIATADAVTDSTIAVLNGEAADFDGSHWAIRGTVHAMDGETEGFFTQTLADAGLDGQSSIADGSRALVLVPGDIGGQSAFELVLYGAACAALLAGAVVTLVRALKGHYQKEITAWCDAQPSPEMARSQLDSFYAAAEPFHSVRADSRFVLYDHGAESWFAPVQDIAWVYQTTTQHRTYFIPTGKTFTVTVRTLTGGVPKTRGIPVRGENGAQEMLNYLRQYLPEAVFGYNVQLEAMFRKDPLQFAPQVRVLRAAAQARSAAQPAADGAADTAVSSAETTAAASAATGAEHPADTGAAAGQETSGTL